MVVLIGMIPLFNYWYTAPPENTCALCHEAREHVYSFQHSAHRELNCTECHGTAFTHGVNSLVDKAGMIWLHFFNNIEDPQMTEMQRLEIMNNCKRCHESQYARWEAGKHAATYADIFLDSVHNSTEQLNYDCLRCHGMFYHGTIEDLVEPISTTGPWHFKEEGRAQMHAIPCMACHTIHTDGLPVKAEILYADSGDSLQYAHYHRTYGVGIYDRAEKTHFTVDELPKPIIYYDENPISISDELSTRNCIQCHAPNARRESGTSDDRTPRGVHEGLSCIACHDPHSGESKNSCITCHPAISNCNIDVTLMNTTYHDKNSPNNIHFVSCADCHENSASSR
ncbi:MAG: cytochrome c3 family protein [Pigmentiphaga sp.]|nr:cytochrome c3 family protein [Pigmentiphaga sp.]